MTLDKAIKHSEEVAEKYKNRLKMYESIDKDKPLFTEEETECRLCAEEHRQLAEWLKDYKRLLEQKPCEDCISRTELLSKIDAERKHLLDLKMDGAEHIVVHHARRIIEDMPPVTPQPKIGEWLEKEVISDKVIEEWQSARCSVCGRYHTTPYMYYFSPYNYCPVCGARMINVPEINDGEMLMKDVSNLPSKGGDTN